MAWFQFWKKKSVVPATPTPPEGAARDESSSGLFAEPEGGDRPAELSGDLDVRAASAKRRQERALAEIRTEMLDNGEDEALGLLDTVEQALSSERLVLPPMPATILRIQQLISDPDCSMEDLAEEIERDPALATKVVGIANSPFYSGMDSIDSVRQAVVRVGMSEVRNFVLAISMRSKVFRVPGFGDAISEMWQHALATSIAAQKLAAATKQDPEVGQLLGLIHDTGRVVFLMVAGSHLRDRAIKHADLLRRIESSVHEPLGGQLAESWNLAPELVAALAYHHDPESAPEASRKIARLIAASDVLARTVIGPEKELADRVLDSEELKLACNAIGVEEKALLSLSQEVFETFEPMGQLI